MKAWRNYGGDIREIMVDVGIDGKVILPPDTTTDPRPQALPGHYTTVVGKEWVQIEIPEAVVSFDTKKQNKLKEVSAYREWLVDRPVEVSGTMFDGDEQARNRLTQALVMNTSLNHLPPFWVTKDNSSFPIATINDLKMIAAGVQQAFATRFYTCDTLRTEVSAATDDTQLQAVVIPTTTTTLG